jgi:hypothetical protein
MATDTPSPAYVVLLGPYSVTQLLVLAGFQVPFGAQVFAAVCWFMIGMYHLLASLEPNL